MTRVWPEDSKRIGLRKVKFSAFKEYRCYLFAEGARTAKQLAFHKDSDTSSNF